MEIVEKYILGKDKDTSLCEDGITVTEDYVVVVDGATSKTGRLYKGKKSGRYLRDIILDGVKTLQGGLSLGDFIRQLEDYIVKQYKEDGVYDLVSKKEGERPSASIGVYSKIRKQVWLLGDVHTLFLYKDGKVKGYVESNKKIDEVMSEARSLFNQIEVAKGYKEEDLAVQDLGREYIRYLLENQQIFQNNLDFESEYNYTVLDGFKSDLTQIEVIDVFEDEGEIILATDGYNTLAPTLKETELILKEDLQRDPNCMYELRGTKGMNKENLSHDDRAYIRIKIK